MDRFFFMTGALSAFVSVAAGAFGAHALRARLAAEALEIFETAARYQMYHALGMCAVAFAAARWHYGAARVAGWCFLVGTILFSGSLYTLSLTGIGMFGAITPLGGLGFLSGWVALFVAARRDA